LSTDLVTVQSEITWREQFRRGAQDDLGRPEFVQQPLQRRFGAQAGFERAAFGLAESVV
jgi:hypothetical protein